MRSLEVLLEEAGLAPAPPRAHLSPPYSPVERGLAELDEGGPDGLSAGALCDDLVWLARQQRRLEAMSARWLAALDRREREGPADPVRSCAWLLHERLHLTPNAAYAQLRTARRLEALPRTAGCLRRGVISAQQAGVICQAVEEAEKTSLERSAVEAELCEKARSLDPYELLRHWRRMRYEADREAGEAAEEERRRRRWLRLWQTWTGGYRIEGELDAEGGSTLRTALRSLMGPPAKGDGRTPAERRADALEELARRQLDGGGLPGLGGERPHLALVAELGTLRLEPGSALAQLEWGGQVTGETARRIGCDAAVTPVLVDEGGEVVRVGRRSRTVPAHVRRALEVRDGRCQWPGCCVPAAECQAHHLRHWADGGAHVVGNMRLFCARHHRLLHPENRRWRAAGGGATSQGRAP